MLSDLRERQQAIATSESFIVQAPAGSGKTELITQRFLNLLAHSASKPEEILAITFTKKAAAEMRHRIVESLLKAKEGNAPLQEPDQTNFRLASQVLKKDREQHWQLLSNPNRLKVLTIDGFCNSLVQQMPVVSEFGAPGAIADNPKELYEEAALATLKTLESDLPYAVLVERLLKHLNNDLNSIVQLISRLLESRDQWLPLITEAHSLHEKNESELRSYLETGIQHVVELQISQLQQTWNDWIHQEDFKAEIDSLIDHVEPYLCDENWLALFTREFDNSSAESLAFWQMLGSWLTTSKGEWRKGSKNAVTAKIGFPAGKDAENKEQKKQFDLQKEKMVDLLSQLNEKGDSLLILFQKVSKLPDLRYQDQQWQLLQALLKLLPLAVAQLIVLFRQRRVVDYIEIAQGALRALGDADAPTDLALKLDYRLQHILIDEFQDTSVSQYKLLEALTAGWQPGDNRSLFVVGDPMQSIYRFRQADVTYFLKTWREGLDNVELSPLQLTSNFRSDANVIDWINDTFKSVFPPQDQLDTGGVRYSNATAGKPHREDAFMQTTSWQWAIKDKTTKTWFGDDSDEQIIKHLTHLKKQQPQASIAILVRARSHALSLVEKIKALQLPLQAVEFEAYLGKPHIQDLLSLTGALIHPLDRISWLSLLRGPLVGLTLEEIHRLISEQPKRSILSCLKEKQTAGIFNRYMDSATQARLDYFIDELYSTLQQAGLTQLSTQVEHCWYRLGGMLLLEPQQIEDCETYFQLLREMEQVKPVADLTEIKSKLDESYGNAVVPGDNPIQIMTIHKSKGLEFDHILLPGMDKSGRGDDKPLLAWSHQVLPDPYDEALMLAPIHKRYESNDSLYDYLIFQEKERAEYEAARLLYVAVTRAKQTLTFFAQTQWDDQKCKFDSAKKRSFLWLLENSGAVSWPSVLDEKRSEEKGRGSSSLNPVQTDFFQNGDQTLSEASRLRYLNTAGYQELNSRCIAPIAVEVASEVDEVIDFSTDIQEKPFNDIEAELLDTPPQRNEQSEDEQRKEWELQKLTSVVFHELLKTLSDFLAPMNLATQEVTVKNDSIQIDLHYIQKLLTGLEMETQYIEQQAIVIQRAIQNLLDDEFGVWLLSSKGFSEKAFMTQQQGEFKKVIPDRVVMDENQCWIVDYKLPRKEQLDDQDLRILKHRYQSQLELYGNTLLGMGYKNIQLCLYMPYHQKHICWPLQNEANSQ